VDFTDLLDIIGGLSLIAFAFLIWPPLALALFGAACLMASWRRTRGGDGQ
jgi:hypothetical protein